MDPGKLSLHQKRFLVVYGMTLFLCFSPLKPLALVSPLFAVFLMIFYVQARPLHNFIRLTVFLFLYACIGLLYFFINKDFLWFNFVFWLITNSSFLFLIISFGELVNAPLLQRMASLTFKVLLVEACLGIVQVLFNAIFITHGFDGATGDAAMGTVNPTFGIGDGKGSNIYYAIGLSALSVLVFMFRKHQKKRARPIMYVTLVLGWIVASVMHSIFLLIVSVFVSVFIFILFASRKKSAGLTSQLKAVRN